MCQEAINVWLDLTKDDLERTKIIKIEILSLRCPMIGLVKLSDRLPYLLCIGDSLQQQSFVYLSGKRMLYLTSERQFWRPSMVDNQNQSSFFGELYNA